LAACAKTESDDGRASRRPLERLVHLEGHPKGFVSEAWNITSPITLASSASSSASATTPPNRTKHKPAFTDVYKASLMHADTLLSKHLRRREIIVNFTDTIKDIIRLVLVSPAVEEKRALIGRIRDMEIEFNQLIDDVEKGKRRRIER